uniref:Resistance protein n=1 Tax=Podoviridae sp. ctiwu7 TaxID=2825269 RepID=A0A8S5QB30_9CAUD|nr:MAG TPA: resistance protein [Podoviridae sp. ctiwu7]
MKLYEISEAIRAALDHIEIDEETGEILSADALHAVEAQAAEKIEATALYLRELDAEAKAAKDEAERMLARVKSMQKRSDYLKTVLLDAIHATGKVKTARVTVSIRKTQAVAIDEGANLPEAYTTVKTTVSPNKIAIKQALTDGLEVPGCRLEERESVSIR